tara:strand:- start:6163 stop:6636 length:474 start_codon:yes stop_codon:yes gene_type:complete
MLLLLNKNNIDTNKISILEKTKNNIINYGYFYRIIYSTENFCLNGLYLSFNIKDFKIDSYFNKYKCSFIKDENLQMIKFLKNIEKNIMDNQMFEHSKPLYRISEQLDQSYIKIFSNNNVNIPNEHNNIDFILKISGIWTEKETYGLTFRFFLSVRDE